jgi:hypothetical protein
LVLEACRAGAEQSLVIDLGTARQLLDFRGTTRSITDEAAEEQLRGAVALHNTLASRKVAYLADEVGMGKTYVALGALALFRHFNPLFRLLVIAPRENIQRKWLKEQRNFVRNNVRFADLRVKAVHGAPARPAVACHNLLELVRDASLNPDRDFFTRLSSFSLPVGAGRESVQRYRRELLSHLPWADSKALDIDLREKDTVKTFKDSFARAVCAALPIFDLVIVDEGHNLKHGFGPSVSARNRVLALTFGHPSEHAKGFRGYGPRARRVLFLSATPLENDYVQLWNQLDVFGFGGAAPELISKSASDDERRACAQQFLIRRVTEMKVGEARLTKNLYRREWRQGGVSSHDEPLAVAEADRDRQRLVVALVQKKVSEVLGHERFNNSFQIGMLASFESFLETAKAKPKEDDEQASTFDDGEQTDDLDERLGVDVGSLNSLARSYRRQFGRELPHPKMDALVENLAAGLPRGRKALVFVRRVASVKELQAKLEERYDDWLIGRLRRDLPSELFTRIEKVFGDYRAERIERRRRQLVVASGDAGELEEEGAPRYVVPDELDSGGLDSFFAWFFRGEGPPRIFSGAALQRRFSQATSAVSTFFEDNVVAWLLDARPGGVLNALADCVATTLNDVVPDLIARAERRLPAGRKDRKVGRLDLFLAIQEAALELLAERPGRLQERARIVLQSIGAGPAPVARGSRAPENAERRLEEPTFFTELRARSALCHLLWPDSAEADFRSAFRERELRRMLLSGTARLGHAFIDLWTLAVRQLGSLNVGIRQDEEDGTSGLIDAYLDELERQMTSGDAEFRAFRELQMAAENFGLIVNVNVPDLWRTPLPEAARTIGRLLGRQQPIGGMFGEINQTLVRQFRLPGYPFVLITTDLLQEGEDLHTFCSAVYHYGISWMPSSMEQRIGRIDRVNSESERRLTRLNGHPDGDHKLQVYYPHLRDTVEVLQVERVLERMNRFIRLMHRDLAQPEGERKQVHIPDEILRLHRDIAPITEPLRTAFPIRDELLRATPRPLAASQTAADGLLARFYRLRTASLGGLQIDWETSHPEDALVGTVHRKGRHQPFTLLLRSFEGRLLLRCVSPIGAWDWETNLAEISRIAFPLAVQIATSFDDKRQAHLLSAEAEVLLADEQSDSARTAWLIDTVTAAADQLETIVVPRADQSLQDVHEALDRESDRAD